MDGLNVIDFPGVDDRDETISDLAELLLVVAQVVIFVVDYKLVLYIKISLYPGLLSVYVGKLKGKNRQSAWPCQVH